MTPTDEIRITHRGAVRQADWQDMRMSIHPTTGEVRRVWKKRPVPEGCRWVHPCEIERLPELARKRAQEIMAKHPRTRGLIVYVGTHNNHTV